MNKEQKNYQVVMRNLQQIKIREFDKNFWYLFQFLDVKGSIFEEETLKPRFE